MTTTENPPAEPVSAPPPEAERPAWAPPHRRNSDTLGIGWFHGALHLSVFRGRKQTATWAAEMPVRTLAEFAPALDAGLTQLAFAGSEVFLLLENPPFIHQMEQAPGFSESAARSFLKNRMARYEKEHEPVLWISQATTGVRQDKSYLLHLLPVAFHDAFQRLLGERRLVLARIIPLVVPVQRELDRFPIAKGRPVLVAVETGGATTLMVAQVGGQILFARTILASWGADPTRIGVEINRSVFYANQQFGLSVERIWLLGQDNASTELVSGKCGTGKQITVLPTAPAEWLQSAAKIPPHHPVNLVADYLRRRRRNFYLRAAVMLTGWALCGLLAMDAWRDAQAGAGETEHLASLRAQESTLISERDLLRTRNQVVGNQQALITALEASRLAPAPEPFLTYVAGLLPTSGRLTDFEVHWDETAANWEFRLEGTVEGDEETAREVITLFRKQLTRSPLRARFTDATRASVAISAPAGATVDNLQRFALEGVILEN